MASLKKAVNCIGLTGAVSIQRDFFGYRNKPKFGLSVGGQMRLVSGPHIHLNLIRTASFTADQEREIDTALHYMRKIYATVGLGVGRLRRFVIPPGFEIIDDDADAQDLWNSWNGPAGAIDVFLARTIVGSEGKAPEGGSCDKDSKNDSGCVVPIVDGSGTKLGQAIAHEVGHFLGLGHVTDQSNLMYTHFINGGKLHPLQGRVMMWHCSINSGCQL